MTEFEKVMMSRDGMSREEAKQERLNTRNSIISAIEDGSSYDDIEEMLLSDCGLEMDYILDLL